MQWLACFCGEIHSDLRELISNGAVALGLPVSFVSPVTDYEADDAAASADG